MLKAGLVLKARLFRTSSFRLALIFAGITGLAFLVLFAVVFWSTARFMRHQIDDSVANEIDEIVTDVKAGGGAPEVVAALARHPSGFHYLLQSPKGRVLAGNMPALDAQAGILEWDETAAGSNAAYAELRGNGVPLGADYLFVGWSTRQVHDMEGMVTRAFLWGLCGSVLLALLGGIVAGGRLMRRIEAVSETSRDIVAGDLSRRIPEGTSGDELDHLAGSINTMLNRIQSLMTDLHQVTTNIAHDMRTPLTRLRHRLESAERSMDPAELKESLGSAVREIDTLLGMFGALLRIAQIESGARRAGFAPVDLGELLMTALELYRPAAEQRGQHLTGRIDSALEVRGDRDLLLQLFANLIENAIRHSPPGARIELEASAAAHGVRVVVSDDGPGIPAALRDKVLQRFVRLERSRTTPGHGLGLSLASAVSKLHDASMRFGDRAPGLEVTVDLPCG